MLIADIDVVNLRFDYPAGGGFRYAGGLVTSRVTSLIRVTTTDGRVGIGTAYSHPDLVRLIVERHLRPHLMGDSPLDTERIWAKMYALTRWYGRKGAAVSALGGIDIALWDLRGKVAEQPLYRVLGGSEPRVPAYASGLFWVDDLSQLEREAAEYRTAGFRSAKIRLGRSQLYDLTALEAAASGIGRDGRLLVDGSHRYSLEVATHIGKALAERGVTWFEEPFYPEDIDSYVALRRVLDVPLAAGENEFGVQGFRELMRAGAVDVAQPDACRTGGITEAVRIATLAAEHGLRIAPHSWSDAVAIVANAHVVAAVPNGLTVEVDRTGNALIDNMLVDPLRIEDGCLLLSDAPGLGIDIDERALERLRVPADRSMDDGNYSDLIFGPAYYSQPPPYEAATIRG